MGAPFNLQWTAGPEDIDELGHVNNAVWVRWIQDVATGHWFAAARPQDRDAYVWMVTRHEIDYRGNISAGETVTAETYIPAPPRGARFDRRVDFRNAAGKVVVSANTTWAMIEKATGRPRPIKPEIAEPFAPFGEP